MKLQIYRVSSGEVLDTGDWFSKRIITEGGSCTLFEGDSPDSLQQIEFQPNIFRRYIKFIFPSTSKVEILVKR